MKKVKLAILFLLFGASAYAQTPYKTALGLGIDVGDGSSFFGPQIKHVFGKNAAIQGQVMFSDYNFMYIGADYQYVKNFPDTRGFAWYVGMGPQLGFNTNHGDYTEFALRPQAGLEFKLPEVPLGLHFDWKPWWRLNHGSHFSPGRFTIGIKFIMK
jgi:hypothetical protein